MPLCSIVIQAGSGAGRHPTSATKQAQLGTRAADEIGLDAMPQIDEADSSSSGEEEREEEEEEEEEQVTILFFRTAMSTHTRTFARASTSLEHLLILTLS